jgi:hypothetical protein
VLRAERHRTTPIHDEIRLNCTGRVYRQHRIKLATAMRRHCQPRNRTSRVIFNLLKPPTTAQPMALPAAA